MSPEARAKRVTWRGAGRASIGLLILTAAIVSITEGSKKALQSPEQRFADTARLYDGLSVHLAGVSRVGFLCRTGSGDEADLRYYLAASTLAPTLVVRSTNEPLAIVVFDSPEELAQLAAGKYRVQARTGPRTAILQRLP